MKNKTHTAARVPDVACARELTERELRSTKILYLEDQLRKWRLPIYNNPKAVHEVETELDREVKIHWADLNK